MIEAGAIRAGRGYVAADLWERAGIVEHWPLTTQEASALLTAAGLTLDADELRWMIRHGLVAAPGMGEADYEWEAVDVVAVMRATTMRPGIVLRSLKTI